MGPAWDESPESGLHMACEPQPSVRVRRQPGRKPLYRNLLDGTDNLTLRTCEGVYHPSEVTMKRPLAFLLATVFLDMLGLGLIVPIAPALLTNLTGHAGSAAVWSGLIQSSYGVLPSSVTHRLSRCRLADTLAAALRANRWGLPQEPMSPCGSSTNFLAMPRSKSV